jgi:hypothetical protein
MSSKAGSATLADAAKAVGDLIAPGAKRGMELLGSIRLPSRSCGCGCDIPPPCWMPQPLGEFTTEACPGNKGLLRLTITNCGVTGRTIKVSATNAAVKVEPASLTLGPLEEGLITLSLEVPSGATKGQTQKSIVWIHGCMEHFLRWTVVVAASGVSCCATEVELEDCPDLIHHWYDHFYCQRPCPNRD